MVIYPQVSHITYTLHLPHTQPEAPLTQNASMQFVTLSLAGSTEHLCTYD